MHHLIKRSRLLFTPLFLLLCLVNSAALAQTQPQVVDVDTSDLPQVRLTISGRLPDGTAIGTDETVIVQHNASPVPAQVVDVDNRESLTLFLVDLPPGVTDSIPLIESSIANYAEAQFMQEGVDYAGIYQIGAESVNELLAPTPFHNAIKNRVTEGLPVSEGATRLFDNLADLIDRIETFKPEAGMSANVVLFSDGTDGLSTTITQDSIAQIPELAAEAGVIIHTVILENVDLFDIVTNEGVANMDVFSGDSGGLALDLSDPGRIGEIYNAVQPETDITVSYTAPASEAGTVPVSVSFPNLPDFGTAGTQVEIEALESPLVIELPLEQRTLELSDFSQPVRIRFPTNYDPAEMTITGEPQLVVNNVAVAKIPTLDQLKTFDSEIRLIEGLNTIYIQYQDENGQDLKTSPVQITAAVAGATSGTDETTDSTDTDSNSGYTDNDYTTGTPDVDGSGVSDITEGASETVDEGRGLFARILRWLIWPLLIGALIFGGYYLYKNYIKDMLARRDRTNDAEPVADYPSQTDSSRRRARRDEAQVVAPSRSDSVDVDNTERPERANITPPPTVERTTQVSVPAGKQAIIDVIDSISTVEPTVTVNRPEFLIGRSPTVDLSFPDDPTVSRIHATIVRDGDIFRIYDEQSTSGTYINDREVPEYGLQLADGDEVHLGAVHLRFKQPK